MTVEAPLEGISGGASTIFLILVYLILGRIDSVSEILTPLKTAGILVILISVIRNVNDICIGGYSVSISSLMIPNTSVRPAPGCNPLHVSVYRLNIL